MAVAKPWDPILVAGGGIPGGPNGVAQPQTDFIHNSAHPQNGQVHASGIADGNIVLMTEEDFTEPCNQGGRIVAADITPSAAAHLHLVPGQGIWAAVKAAETHAYPAGP